MSVLGQKYCQCFPPCLLSTCAKAQNCCAPRVSQRANGRHAVRVSESPPHAQRGGCRPCASLPRSPQQYLDDSPHFMMELGRAATPAHQQSSQTEPRAAAATACHVSHPSQRSRCAPLPRFAGRKEQQSTPPASARLVAGPSGALRVWRRGVPKGRPRGIGRLWGDWETGKGRLGRVGALRPPCPGGCIGRVAGSGRRSGGQRARKGGGVRRAPGRRPGVGWGRGRGSRGRPGVARHGAGTLSGRVAGIRRRAGKHGVGAGLRGTHVSHGDRSASERSRWESSVGCGADRHAWGRAVGQREGRCPRGDRLRLRRVCRGLRRWQLLLLLLRVPARLLQRCRLPQDLLQLLHPDPAQVGQLPHHGELLKEGLQGHLALQELLSHFLQEKTALHPSALPPRSPYRTGFPPLPQVCTEDHRTTHKPRRGNPIFFGATVSNYEEIILDLRD